jgi:hypothetical protein
VLDDLRAWCEAHKIDRVRELSGGAHG